MRLASRPIGARAVLAVMVVSMMAGCDGTGADTVERGLADADTPADLRQMVDHLMPQIERLSGLDQGEPISVRRQSRGDVRRYVAARLDHEMPLSEREGARRSYVALGLLPDTLDLDALLLDLYTEQVLGYYDPGDRTLFVIDDADAESLRPVLVHELVHALQDQHTNLDSIAGRERGNDRQTAAHAAMEGHAMLVMFGYLAEEATGDAVDPTTLPSPAAELGPALEAQNEQYPVFARAPAIIRETLLFPYLYGADFVHRLWTSRAPLARYPAPIDSLLPQSTEQVMRPDDRFIIARDEPVDVRFEDDAGSGSVVYEDTFGQLETGIFLEQHLGAGARATANGWDGDRFRLVEHDGNDVLHWISVWETESAATAFADAVRRAGALRAGRRVTVERVAIGGRAGVRVTIAAAAGS